MSSSTGIGSATRRNPAPPKIMIYSFGFIDYTLYLLCVFLQMSPCPDRGDRVTWMGGQAWLLYCQNFIILSSWDFKKWILFLRILNFKNSGLDLCYICLSLYPMCSLCSCLMRSRSLADLLLWPFTGPRPGLWPWHTSGSTTHAPHCSTAWSDEGIKLPFILCLGHMHHIILGEPL